MIRNYPSGLLISVLPITILIYLGSFIWEALFYKSKRLALTRLQALFWTIVNFPYLLQERKKIRSSTVQGADEKIIKLFSKADLLGKSKDVVLHRIRQLVKKVQYSLPLTYPAEIKKLIPQGSSILDVGCGDGYLMTWINHNSDYNVVGIDINESDTILAKNRLTGDKRPVYKEIIVGDLTKEIPFRKKFDVVLCSQLIEHLKKEEALELIEKMERLTKKRIIIASINGFFQFNHRLPSKYDIHLSGWYPREFISKGYKVWGSGLAYVYKPGALKDQLPHFFHPLLFILSYIATPILHFVHFPALLFIAHKDIDEKI